MGMELGRAARLLQPWLLGWLGESLSTAAGLVSSATGRVCESAGVPWKLGLSAKGLPAT
jgi:hypothetical protein